MLKISSLGLSNWKGKTQSIENIGSHALVLGAHGAGKTAMLSAVEFALTGCVPMPDGSRRTQIGSVARFAGPERSGGTGRTASVDLQIEDDVTGKVLSIQRSLRQNHGGTATQELFVNGRQVGIAAGNAQISRSATVVDAEAILRMKPPELRAYLCSLIGIEGDDPLPALREKFGDLMPQGRGAGSWVDELIMAATANDATISDLRVQKRAAEAALSSVPAMEAANLGGTDAATDILKQADNHRSALGQKHAAAADANFHRERATQTIADQTNQLKGLADDFDMPKPPEVCAATLRSQAQSHVERFDKAMSFWNKAEEERFKQGRRQNELSRTIKQHEDAAATEAITILRNVIKAIGDDGPTGFVPYIQQAIDIIKPLALEPKPWVAIELAELDDWLAAHPSLPKPAAPDTAETQRQASDAQTAEDAVRSAQTQQAARVATRAEIQKRIHSLEEQLNVDIPQPPTKDEMDAAEQACVQAREQLAAANLAQETRRQMDAARVQLEEQTARLGKAQELKTALQATLDEHLGNKLKPFTTHITESLCVLKDAAEVLARSATERGRLVLTFVARQGICVMDYETLSGAERKLFWIGVAIAHAKLNDVPNPIMLVEFGDFSTGALRTALDHVRGSGIACMGATHAYGSAEVAKSGLKLDDWEMVQA